MTTINVHYIDTLENPEEAGLALSAIQEEAKEIEGQIDKPLLIAFRLEEVGIDGEPTNEIIKMAVYNRFYLEPLFDFVLNQSEDPEGLFDFKEEIGSDVVKELSGDFGTKIPGRWKMTEIALVNPIIPAAERIIDEESALKEIVKKTPEYTRHYSNSGFFNGKLVKSKVEEFKANPDKNKRGLMLLLDILEDPDLQIELFKRCQIPLISTINDEKAREEMKKRAEDIEKEMKAMTKEENQAEKEGRVYNPENVEYFAQSEKKWLASLDPIIRNQIKEFVDMKIIQPFNHFDHDSIMNDPCVLYTLKQAGVSKEIRKELKKEQFIYGNTIKTGRLVKALNPHKIQLCVNRVENYRTCRSNKHPKKIDESWTTIKVDVFENHMFIHTKLYAKSIKREISVLRMLQQGFEYGLLEHFSAYEFGEYYQNYVFDSMIKFDHNEFIRKTPNNTSLEKYSKQVQTSISLKNYPDKVYYADFEATTNEDHHIPFMVCCIGPDMDQTFIGEDCAKQMLLAIAKEIRFYKDPRTQEDKQENVRVYFHNLKYDFTYIQKYLIGVKTCERGMKLYSAEGGIHLPKGGGFRNFQFWDTLPIMRCKLSQAADYYIGGEEAKKFKKELCPYGFYTRENFKKFKKMAPVEEFIAGFASEEEKSKFRQNLQEMDSLIYNAETKEIDYMKYSEFYCHQDVVVMKRAFENIGELFLGNEEIPGINGKPPFHLDIFNFRTISSLAWYHFLKTTFGHYFPDPTGKDKTRKVNTCPICEYQGPVREWLREAGRGGRTMNGDNESTHYISPDTENPDYDIVDYDAVSLYPSAGSRSWISEGVPTFIKSEGNQWGRKEFEEWFAKPEETEHKTKYSDGALHITKLNVKKDRSFPLICIKDPSTHLNNYENFHDAQVDTIISMTDLYNLIDLQDAEFSWDAAIVWTGKRNFECQQVFKDLNDFRNKNHNLKDDQGNPIPDHPIASLTKLVNNSIYGKSNQKLQHYETRIIEKNSWSHWIENGVDRFKKEQNWDKFFNANAFRIIDFEYLEGQREKVKVRLYNTDQGYSLTNFAVTILGVSKRIIGPVIAMAEEAADALGVHRPFYTDTDSVHLIRKTLPMIEAKFQEKYNCPLSGKNLGQFHIDFDTPSNFKKDPKTGKFIEQVRGAIESYFCAKKIYVDKLLGTQGSIGLHPRMKGVRTSLITWDDFVNIYNDKPTSFDLVEGGPSFEYKNGNVSSLPHLIRRIMSRKCRAEMKADQLMLRYIDQQMIKEVDSITDISDELFVPMKNPPFTLDDEPPAKRQKI